MPNREHLPEPGPMSCHGAPGCAGPVESGTWKKPACWRHVHFPDAPPMLLTCECAYPDVQHLRAYGPSAAQCRRCGSPLEGTIT
jgi:hypothetical protein